MKTKKTAAMRMGIWMQKHQKMRICQKIKKKKIYQRIHAHFKIWWMV